MDLLSVDGKPIKVAGKFIRAATGAVSSVNGKTGAVTLTAKDVGALPETGFDILDKSSLVTTTWGDNITWQLSSFARWGAVCTFTVQFVVNTEISSTYGFDVVTLPYHSSGRIWVNNQSAFWIDSGGNTIRRNGSSIAKGAYILAGLYLTSDPEQIYSRKEKPEG